MTGNTYAQALYELVKDEGLETAVLEELRDLKTVFRQNPRYTKLLSAPDIPKQERCGMLEAAFQGKVHPYVLNFMKILTEKGYIRHFPACCEGYRSLYNEDHGILTVKVQSAVELTAQQKEKLSEKLQTATGKTVELQCSVDPAVLGGLRLSYDGKQVDGTVRNKLDSIGRLLKNTVLG